MPQETMTVLTAKAMTVLGLGLDIAAIVWLARDWKYSQFSYEDWKKLSRRHRAQAIADLERLWEKFSGDHSKPHPVWRDIDPDDLIDLMGQFPANGDHDSARERKIEVITSSFGVGPSDDDLRGIRAAIERLAQTQHGVPLFRGHVRSRTIKWAFGLLIIGLVFQIIGSWPTTWFDTITFTTSD